MFYRPRSRFKPSDDRGETKPAISHRTSARRRSSLWSGDTAGKGWGMTRRAAHALLLDNAAHAGFLIHSGDKHLRLTGRSGRAENADRARSGRTS